MLVDDLLARHEGNLRRCLDDLSTFGRLRRDLDRRLAGQESHHPTVASISIANPPRAEGEEAALNGDSGPNRAAAAFAADDDDDQEQDADYEWSLGAPGAVGNRFQILHLHARGGIGVVSVAFDSELQREVALKQIKTESADDSDSRARFLLEAEVTGRLEHPGVVPVYGLGFDEQGVLTTPCASCAESRSKRRSPSFIRPMPPAAETQGTAPWNCGSCWAGSSAFATPWLMPTAGGCCTAISSRPTCCSALTTRR